MSYCFFICGAKVSNSYEQKYIILVIRAKYELLCWVEVAFFYFEDNDSKAKFTIFKRTTYYLVDISQILFLFLWHRIMTMTSPRVAA